MLFRTLANREVDVSITPYHIDWDHVVSGPQKRVKDFLRPYWRHHTVLEEMRIPSSRLRLDLFNINLQIVVEVSPEQHQQYNPFLHGSIAGFTAACKRDMDKERWCILNGFTFCELVAEDLAGDLTPELFLTRFNVTL